MKIRTGGTSSRPEEWTTEGDQRIERAANASKEAVQTNQALQGAPPTVQKSHLNATMEDSIMSIPDRMDETLFHSIIESEGDSTMHATMDSSVASIARPTMRTLADVHSPPRQAPRHSTPITGIRPLRIRPDGRNSLRREPQFSTIAELEQSRLQDETLDAEISKEMLYRQRLATPQLDPLMTSSGYMMPNMTRPDSPRMDSQLMLRQHYMEQERIR